MNCRCLRDTSSGGARVQRRGNWREIGGHPSTKGGSLKKEKKVSKEEGLKKKERMKRVRRERRRE